MRIKEVGSAVLLILILTGFTLGLGVHASTYLGIDPREKIETIWYVLQLSSALAFIPAIIFFSRQKDGTDQSPHDIYDTILVSGFGFFMVYAIVNFMVTSMILNHEASPEIVDGQYVLYSHGAVVRKLNAAEFIKHKIYEARMHSGHWMILYVVAAAAVYKNIKQRARLSHLVLLALLVLSPVRLAAQSQQASLPPDKLKKIEAVIAAEMARQKIPAVSVAVVINNRLQWSNGYGVADIENSVAARSTTSYRLASVSKPITAVAAMQLAERGRLDLDAPVQKYCPAFPQKQWPITARQLLAHVSGIRHYKSLDEVLSTKHYNSLTEALDIFKDDALLFEPGTKFSYTTFGYVVLGCEIEGASGMKYADYVRANISTPAGMTSLRVDDALAIIPHRAQGYSKTESGELQNSTLADTSNKIPGGGLTATVEDLAKFAIALQAGKLLREETLGQMWTPQKTRDGQATGGALGWALTGRNGQREVWHDGGQQRVSTILYLLPDRKFAVVLMTNLEGVKMIDFARQLADAAQ